jgi:hypothetical protein
MPLELSYLELVLVKIGQKVNSLPHVQLPMQNCINVQCFVVHAAHCLKAYQVNFPTQPTTHHLDFPRWSYCQNTEDYTEDQQPHGNSPGIHFVEPLSHSLSYLFFISCFHLSRRVVPNINTPLLQKYSQTFDNRNVEPFLFSCVLTNIERVISIPLLLRFPSRDYRSGDFIRSQLVLLLPLRFPRLIVGCVGWFLESVVRRILNSGCRLKTVVGFEFYLICQVALVIATCSKLSWLL